MRTRKLLSGLGATVMSLMMIIPWAVYADSPQVVVLIMIGLMAKKK